MDYKASSSSQSFLEFKMDCKHLQSAELQIACAKSIIIACINKPSDLATKDTFMVITNGIDKIKEDLGKVMVKVNTFELYIEKVESNLCSFLDSQINLISTDLQSAVADIHDCNCRLKSLQGQKGQGCGADPAESSSLALLSQMGSRTLLGNKGRLQVLEGIGIKVGKKCAKTLRAVDINRIQKSEIAAKEETKKAKKRTRMIRKKLLDEENEKEPDYEAR
ncbi:hypothetical protein J6590_017613, partial [Homalodisca vitripennis]